MIIADVRYAGCWFIICLYRISAGLVLSKQIKQNNEIMATKIIDRYMNYEKNYQFYKSNIFQAKNHRLWSNSHLAGFDRLT